MRQELSEAIKHWNYISPLVKQPRNRKEHDELVSLLDELLDIVGEDERHNLMSLVDIISHLISSYEEMSASAIKSKGVDALKFLMQAHQLTQADLSMIGSQGVVSEILNGKRALNLRQIKSLAKKFQVDPSTFIDD